jgi:hypothetical protein
MHNLCPTVSFWAYVLVIYPIGPFPDLPTVAPQLGVFSCCCTHIEVYEHRFVGVINPGSVNELPSVGEALAIALKGDRWG